MYGQSKSIENHIVVLGWSERTRTLITALREHAASAGIATRPMLVVTANSDVGTTGDDRIYFVFGKPTDPEVVKHANLEKAHLVFIPQGESGDIEALTALLGIIALRPQVRVCVELSSADHADVVSRLAASGQLGSKIEIISSEHLSRSLLRHALDLPGAAQLCTGLLNPEQGGSTFQCIELPLTWQAQSFAELSSELFKSGAILIAYSRGDALVVNPPNRGQLLQPGDTAWLIAVPGFVFASQHKGG